MVLYERNPHAGRHSAAGEGTHTGIKECGTSDPGGNASYQ